MQFLVLAEFGIAAWGDQKGLNAVGLQDVDQLVVGHVYLLAHEDVTHDALLYSGKAFQQETHRFLGPDVLGNGYTVVLHAEDVCPQSTFTGEGHVVEHFRQQAHQPHREGGDSKDEEKLRTVNQVKNVEIL